MKPSVRIYYKSKNSDQRKDPYQAGGLASNALHSVAVLNSMGIPAALSQVDNYGELLGNLSATAHSGLLTVTHVIIEALWVTPEQVEILADFFPTITFVYRAHSKMGFLQVEPQSILVMRRIIEIGKYRRNVLFSSNNEEFCQAIREVFGNCVYLPNLYDLASAPKHHHHYLKPLRLKIASFGASRLLKLHPSAALAARQIGRRRDQGIDFYVNKDSTPGGASVRKSVANIFVDNPTDNLIELGWQDAQIFKDTIARMDLVFQLSATETFCMVAADAIAAGVPVVVGPAISWLPSMFQVNIDDTSEAAAMGVWILNRRAQVVRRQQEALYDFIDSAKKEWSYFLGLEKRMSCWIRWLF